MSDYSVDYSRYRYEKSKEDLEAARLLFKNQS